MCWLRCYLRNVWILLKDILRDTWKGNELFDELIRFYHILLSVISHVLIDLTSFQIFSRKIRFQLERAPGETSLIDRSGRTLKMEPLTNVGALEKYLLKMVGKLVIFLYHFLFFCTNNGCICLLGLHVVFPKNSHCKRWFEAGRS